MLAGLVWLFRKSIRLPSPKQVPIVPSIIAIGAMWTLAWLAHQLGQMSSDECGSLGPEGWELIKFIRGDSGLPSRVYRTLSWFVMPFGGLASLHLMSLIAATVSALLLLSTGKRLMGHLGWIAAAGVLLYEPWLKYNWEARSYSFFLAWSCVALWQACRQIDDDDAPPMGGILLATGFACMENPLCIILAFAALIAKSRRYGFSSISRPSWVGLGLITAACTPFAIQAIEAHRGFSHHIQPDTYSTVLFAIAAIVPGLFAQGRRGWLAETALIASIATGFAIAFDVVPVHERVFLVAVPWVLGGFLSGLHSKPKWVLAAGFAVIAAVITGNSLMLNKRINQSIDRADTARSTHQYLETADAKVVHFEPRHARYPVMSIATDLRHIESCGFNTHPPGLPQRYQTNDKPTCADGEYTVSWNRKKTTCDCPVVAEFGAWRIHTCSDDPRSPKNP